MIYKKSVSRKRGKISSYKRACVWSWNAATKQFPC